MSGTHKYPTISFRISPRERQEIEWSKVTMTEMEKHVMFRMAIKLVEYGIIEQDKEAENLVQWFLLSSRIKENNAQIRELMKNYKETELPAREGVKEALKRNQEICRRRDELYHQQNDLKGIVAYKLEQELSW